MGILSFCVLLVNLLNILSSIVSKNESTFSLKIKIVYLIYLHLQPYQNLMKRFPKMVKPPTVNEMRWRENFPISILVDQWPRIQGALNFCQNVCSSSRLSIPFLTTFLKQPLTLLTIRSNIPPAKGHLGKLNCHLISWLSIYAETPRSAKNDFISLSVLLNAFALSDTIKLGVPLLEQKRFKVFKKEQALRSSVNSR